MKLGYVLLYVPNVEESLAFYERAFGLKRQLTSDDYGELETGPTTLGFVSRTLAESSGMKLLDSQDPTSAVPAEIALVTEDVQQAYEYAVEQGAQPVKPPEEKPWGQTVSYVRDNEGFLVEICSKVQAP